MLIEISPVPDHPPRRWPVGPIRISTRSRREADAAWQMLRSQRIVTAAEVFVGEQLAFAAQFHGGRWLLTMAEENPAAPGG